MRIVPPGRQTPIARVLLKPEQTIDLDDECAVREVGEPGGERVAPVAVDHEQLAARLVLPAESRVGAQRPGGRVVLNERADEQTGVQAEGMTRGYDGAGKHAARQADPIDRCDRLNRKLRRELETASGKRKGTFRAAV